MAPKPLENRRHSSICAMAGISTGSPLRARSDDFRMGAFHRCCRPHRPAGIDRTSMPMGQRKRAPDGDDIARRAVSHTFHATLASIRDYFARLTRFGGLSRYRGSRTYCVASPITGLKFPGGFGLFFPDFSLDQPAAILRLRWREPVGPSPGLIRFGGYWPRQLLRLQPHRSLSAFPRRRVVLDADCASLVFP